MRNYGNLTVKNKYKGIRPLLGSYNRNGGVANFCVETTARMVGNLGFEVLYAFDAVWAYGATGPDGVEHSAEQVHSMSLCNLDGEFAKVMKTQAVLDMIDL